MLEKTLRILDKIPPGTYLPDTEVAFDAKELDDLAGLLRRLLYSPSSLRKFLQSKGVTIVPANYYSEIPTIEEIEESFLAGELRYGEELFDKQVITQFLEEIFPYSSEFDPPVKLNEERTPAYSWESGQYSYSDAMSYYAIVRHLKPKTVVEIGSGFSSLIAIEALRKNGVGSLTCVEPYPRDFLRHNESITLVQGKAQDINVEFLNATLDDGDVLFIDSTHTVKHGSDCLHIYLNLLPRLKKRAYIHVHDIYLPFSFPIKKLRDRQIYWTEQYLLAAYLLDNPKCKVLYGSAYNYRFNRELLEAFMHGRFGAGGASIWFSISP